MLAVAGTRRQRPTQPVQPPPAVLRAAPGAGGSAKDQLPRRARHTCTSLMFQKNMHPKLVQEFLGHASIAITLDTYSHMLPGMGGEAADAMEGALG